MEPGAVPVLYVAGVGRSGSTVLARSLARRPGVVSVGELRYIWDRGLAGNHLCGCGAPFNDCAFWTEVLARAFGTAGPDSLAAAAERIDRVRYIPAHATRRLRGESFARTHRTYAAGMATLYRAILDVSGGTVVLDSSKDPSYAYAVRGVDGLDVTTLHLVRDSRAVAHSWTRRRVRPEIHWTTEYMRTLPPSKSARRWVQYNALFDALRALPGRAHLIRYEDFAADPGAVADAILGPGADEARAAQGATHDISGNPTRFDDDDAVRADEAWKWDMPARERRLVTSLTAPMLMRYGYSLAVRP